MPIFAPTDPKILTEERFNRVVERMLDKCMEQARQYDTLKLLRGVPKKDQPELKERMTHLNDDEFFIKRKHLYREILRETFTRNGEIIKPSTSKHHKQRLFIAGPTSSGKTRFFNMLKTNQGPQQAQNLFNEINKNAILVDLDHIRDALPEYRQAEKEKYTHAYTMVRGEVRVIAETILRLAKEFGHNIIENTSSFDKDLSQNHIKSLKSGGYDLSFIGVVTEPENILKWAKERQARTGRSIPPVQLADSIHAFSRPNVFPNLMRNAEHAQLYWNNADNKGFSPVSHSDKGRLKIDNHAKWKEFGQQRDFALSGVQSRGVA